MNDVAVKQNFYGIFQNGSNLCTAENMVNHRILTCEFKGKKIKNPTPITVNNCV